MQKHTTQVSFRLSKDTHAALDAIKARDGIPLSEQLRRALQLWLDQQARQQADVAMIVKSIRRGKR
jgi:predicted transcriptional regulator